MQLWIRNTDETYPMTRRQWKKATWASFATELWKPLGTRAPRWWPAEQPWKGNYVLGDDPVLSGQDCRNMAAGLENFLAQQPTARRGMEPSALLPLDLRLIDDEDRYAGGPYFVRLSSLLRECPELRDELPPLIEFLRRVPPMGEMVVHYAEITVRGGVVVGAP